MSRRTLIWHLGLADAARPVVPLSLDVRREELGAHGVAVVADRHEADLATVELLRTHREAGLARREVEGRWAAVADRVWAHRGTSVVSTPQLCVADTEQLRLALDPLIGIEVHLVLTLDPLPEQLYGAWVAELLRGGSAGWRDYSARVQRPVAEPGHGDALSERFWAGHDPTTLLGRWGWTLRPDRLHVVAGTPEAQWAHLLDLAGLPDAAAGSLAPVVPEPADPSSAAVLREVNRRAESPLTPVQRELVLATRGPDPAERPLVPAHPVDALAPLVERWATVLRAEGRDLRGELGSLLDCPVPASLPGPRRRLATSARALAETLTESQAQTASLRTQVAELQAEVERLDRKRRTWKRRAKAQAAPRSPESTHATAVGAAPEQRAG